MYLPKSQQLKRIVPYFLFAVMTAVVAWRLYLIFSLLDEPSGCGTCLVVAAALSDAPFLLTWSAVAIIGFNSRISVVGWLFRCLSGVGLLIYIADVYVLHSFFTRLYVTWVINIGATPGVVIDHLIDSGIIDLLGLILLLGLLITVLFHRPQHPKSRPRLMTILAIGLATSLIANSFNRVEYVHAWVTDNVFLTNQLSGMNQAYSREYLEPLASEFGDVPSCSKGVNKQSDVIVLILESWSPYHSQLWGGMNWTPSLDVIAEKSIRFNNFIAGGFNTNQGLLSIISGVPILSSLTSPFTRKAFEPGWGWDYSLPRQLGKSGYKTAFLTSGDLSFHGKAEWIEHAGFDYVEDHSHPVYLGQSRGHFNAAPDEVLFDRTISYWKEKKNLPGAVGIVVESVSSHTPFYHPITKERGEETAIRYMDYAVGRFFNRLQAEEFFSSGGVLVLVSDHRSMTVVRDDEYQLYGPRAPALVPMLIHSDLVEPEVTDRMFHQADVAPSLAQFLTTTGCGYPDWRNVFEVDKNASGRCVFHASGSDWEKLLVYCENGYGEIVLDGDDSHFVGNSNIPNQRKIELLKKVAYFRNSAQKNTDKFLQRVP